MDNFFQAWITYKGIHAYKLGDYNNYRNLLTDFQKSFIAQYIL